MGKNKTVTWVSIVSIAILAAAALSLWGLKIFSKKNPLSFLENRGKTVNRVKKPRDIFKNRPMFFFKSKNFIDFSVKERRFAWKIDEDVRGNLQFETRIVINKGKVLRRKMLPRGCRFRLSLERGEGSRILLEKEFAPKGFEEARGYFTTRQYVSLFHQFREQDVLVFEIESPPGFDLKNTLYGISVPALKISAPPGNEGKPAPTGHTNLLLISIDTLRHDYVGIYRELEGENTGFSYSPNLDAFSREAVVFKNAYTPLSSTWPALMSMLTSRYPCEHGILYNRDQLHVYLDTVATYLLNRGYATLSMHGNGFGMQVPGIETKHDFFDNDPELIDAAVLKLRGDSGIPFFHWYHFMGVHHAYKPPDWVMAILEKDRPFRDIKVGRIMKDREEVSREDLDYIRKQYAGELFHLDYQLKKIFEFLKINGLWDRTLIIVTADHGEDLYQHKKNMYHYPSLYNTSLKIPLMIKFPGQGERIVVEEPVSLIDIFPTVYDYFGGGGKNRDGAAGFSGLSLLGLLQGEKELFRERVLFAGVEKFQIVSSLQHHWKFIYNPRNLTPLNHVGHPYPFGKMELYRLLEDPYERKNVYREHFNKVVSRHIRYIDTFKKDHPRIEGGDSSYNIRVSRRLSRQALERLRTLGYIK